MTEKQKTALKAVTYLAMHSPRFKQGGTYVEDVNNYKTSAKIGFGEAVEIACETLYREKEEIQNEEASVTEEGMLVFLPCKIGSEVYHKSFFSDIVVSSIVKEILITPYGYQVRALDSANALRRFEKQELGVKWFVTRAEAEAAPKRDALQRK